MTIGRDGVSTLRLEGVRTTDNGTFVCQVDTTLFFITNKIGLTAGWDGRRGSAGGGASSYSPGFNSDPLDGAAADYGPGSVIL